MCSGRRGGFGLFGPAAAALLVFGGFAFPGLPAFSFFGSV